MCNENATRPVWNMGVIRKHSVTGDLKIEGYSSLKTKISRYYFTVNYDGLVLLPFWFIH